MRAATATPDPLLEPPGVLAVVASHGFQGVPICWLVPHPPNANSTVWVLPSTIMPAEIMRRAMVAVTTERRLRQLAEPPVVTCPSSSIRSLSAIGTPCKGPIAWSARMALCAASGARTDAGSREGSVAIRVTSFISLHADEGQIDEPGLRQDEALDLRTHR